MVEWVEIGIAASASALVIGILVYALGSFVLMRPYTTSRAVGVSVRELGREILLALVTQPLLPLYYLLGRRMEPLLVRPLPGTGAGSAGTAGVPVVFVHGYMQNRVGFVGLAYALARRGLGPLYGFNYPWFSSIAANAARLERFVARVREETRAEAVDLVCHSMGGVVAMEMMRGELEGRSPSNGEPGPIRRCVTIATPHAGIAWRGPVLGFGASSLRRGSPLLEMQAGYRMTVPTLSLYSSHDNIVHPKETSQLVKRGGRDVEISGYGHLAILFSSEVADHVASFLTSDAPFEAIVRAGYDDGRASERRRIDERLGDEPIERGGGDERGEADERSAGEGRGGRAP